MRVEIAGANAQAKKEIIKPQNVAVPVAAALAVVAADAVAAV